MSSPATQSDPLQAAMTALHELRQAADAAAGLPGKEARERCVAPLDEVHDAVMRVVISAADPAADNTTDNTAGDTSDNTTDPAAASIASAREALAEVAAVIAEDVPPGTENKLTVRKTTLVRLLRHGALDPAWVLAGDNASGVVKSSRSAMRWAGGSRDEAPLALPTLIDDGRVYAWLPGFRDPRWDVPDAVYDISKRVVLAGKLQHMAIYDGRLRLAGSAYLGWLAARSDDEVTVVLSGPGGVERRFRAERTRTAEYTKPSGAELTRRVWAGWFADVDLAELTAFGIGGGWAVALEVRAGSLLRTGPLGTRRGPLGGVLCRPGAATDSDSGSGVDAAGDVPVRVTSDDDGAVQLVVSQRH